MSRVVRSTCWITEGGEEGDEEDEGRGSDETQWKNVFGLQEWLTRAPQGKRPWTGPKASAVALGDTLWALRVTLTPIVARAGWRRGKGVGSGRWGRRERHGRAA